MLDNAEMSRRIKAAIEGSAHNQATIAAEFGITEQAVSGWIKTGKVDKRKLPKLAALTGVHLQYFMPSDSTVPAEPASHLQTLDLETLRSAIVSVKEAVKALDLEMDVYDVAPIIAFAYRERAKLSPKLPRNRLREFDAKVKDKIEGELANERPGPAAPRSTSSTEKAAPKRSKTRPG